MNGFKVIPNVLATHEITTLLEAIGPAVIESAAARRGGIRNLVNLVPAVRKLAEGPTIRELVDPILGERVRFV